MMQHMPVTAQPGPERRILVVDDEKRMADSLKTLLTSSGYCVDVAYCGREALEKLKMCDYPVVITDIKMDDVDGFELMRATGETRRTAFIIITGHVSTESAIQAVHHKAFEYLAKPFEFDDLKNALDRAFAAVQAERFKEDLISMITHDIKIPLSSIIGYASLIVDKSTGQVSPRAKEFVQTIYSNALKILSLIDNFLTSCRIERGKLTLFYRSVNVNFLIEDLISVFQADAERKNLVVEDLMDKNVPPIEADENLLYRAVSNIVANAYKFTPVGGMIRLVTRFLPISESPLRIDSVVIEVANTGPGIPEKDLPHIFDKFRRASIQNGVEGTGLGLYIASNVVLAHGGKIEVSSSPNELTIFRVILPIVSTAEHQA